MLPDNEIEESDCCGNGCTNCILDNKPKPSKRALLAGKRNVILNYANFRLLSNETHNGDPQIRLLHFGYAVTSDNKDDDDDEDCILDIPPGHHVMLRVELPNHATPLLRPYSPYWTDFTSKEFKILVKLQPNGPMSTFLATLQPLEILKFRGPIGNYVHDASTPKCIVIIAQGVAIAPTLPLVSQVLDNEDDMNRIRHLICAKDLQHVYFRDRLLEFAQYWNYHSCLYLAHQQCNCSDQNCQHFRKQLRYKESASTGRLDAEQLAARVSPKDGESIIVIIAGYSSFQRQMREQAIQAFNLTDDHIFLL